MTICESILAILVLPTNPKVVACVSTILNTIINELFLPSTVIMVVIVLCNKVSSTYVLM
jgi:hypothetical protein